MSYKIKGWKSRTAGDTVLKTFGNTCNFIREESNEEQINKESKNDDSVLPSCELIEKDSSMESVDIQRQTSQMPSKGLFAKDKRRLREKRRSTGIAKLTSETIENHDDDEETLKNTSFNESASSHHTTDAVLLTIGEATESSVIDNIIHHDENDDDDDKHQVPQSQHQQLSETCSSKHGSSQINSSGLTSPRCESSVKLNPVIESNQEKKPSCIKSAKPILPSKPIRSGFLEKPINNRLACSNCAKKTEEEIKLHIRIKEMEKQLELERSHNLSLQEVIASKDLQLQELETEIRALNEDLDLADEDYIRLENENKALLRGLSQIDLE